ncbi:hypothetical protein ACX3YD_22175 [Pseudomonas fluorescens group sp. PF-1]
MSEVKRYSHIAYLVTATDRMLELYPDMKVYVLASDFDSVRHDLSEMTDNYNIVVRQKMEFAKDRDAAQSELAALREELAASQSRHDRIELALNGSMKALTLVDNMWKKRWLDKTGEPAMALIVDDEFKALFEEIKGLKHSLAAAEQRNAELCQTLKSAVGRAAKKWFYESFDDELLELMQKAGLIEQAEGFSLSVIATLQLDVETAIDAALQPTESGASECSGS